MILSRQTIIVVILLLLSGGIFSSSNAQTHHFRNYSVEDGLPFIYVHTIYQDSKGNLWTGSYAGLSKFDGYTFTNYGREQGLINNLVHSIIEDKEGDLWIGTGAGVSRFNGTTFTNYTMEDGLVDNQVYTMFMDQEENLWFGTQRGISIYNGKEFSTYTGQEKVSGKEVHAIFQDSKGDMWFGTKEGISKHPFRQGDEAIISNIENNFTGQGMVQAILEDRKGNLWFGTESGLNRYGNDVLTNFTTKNGLSGDVITSLNEDNNGNIWVGTSTGLSSFDGKEFNSYTIGDESNSNIIETLFRDFEENLWIGTYSGFYRYRNSAFITYSEKDGLTNNFIFGLLRNSKGELLIGTAGDGMQVFDGKKFKPFMNKELSGKSVWCIMEYPKGTTWISTDKGLYIQNESETAVYTQQDGLISDSATVLLKDSKGNIWIGGQGGVTKFDGQSFTTYDLEPENDNYTVWSICEDKQGNIWFGSYLGGLYKYDWKTFTDYSEKLGLVSDAYLSIVEDSEGNLWFGSFDGVFRYDGKEVISFTEKDGLSSNLVYLMTIDNKEEYLWIGTNQGLNKLKLQHFNETGEKKIEHYGKEEGFDGVECNSNGVWKDDDGTIWFGTVNGLIKYNPNDYSPNEEESKTSITGIHIFYKDTALPSNATLPYYLNNISFEYVGICLTNPQKVQYSFMLEGYDKGWSPSTTQKIATYSNLKPGKYTFKVKSCNNEMKWNIIPASFSFTIDAPYWQTWWFRFFLVLITGLLIWLSFYLRINNIKKKNTLLRKMDMLKLEALRSQMNPHFLFNSMNAIQHYINSNEKKQANDYLTKFAKLMRTILDNSQKTSITISEDIEALELYLSLEHLRFEDQFSYEIEKIGRASCRERV